MKRAKLLLFFLSIEPHLGAILYRFVISSAGFLGLKVGFYGIYYNWISKQ